MRYKLLFLVLMSVIAVQSWGFYNGQIITPEMTSARGDVQACAYCTFEITDVTKNEVAITNCTAEGPYSVPGKIYVIDPNSEIAQEFTVTSTVNTVRVFDKVTKLTLPEGLTTFSGSTIYYSDHLTEIHFPSTLQKFVGSLWQRLDVMTNITIASGAAYEIQTTTEGQQLIVNKSTNKIRFILWKATTNKNTCTIPDNLVGMEWSVDGKQEEHTKTVTLPASWNSSTNLKMLQPKYGMKLATGNAAFKIYNPESSTYGGILMNSEETEIALIPEDYGTGVNKPEWVFTLPETVTKLTSKSIVAESIKSLSLSHNVTEIENVALYTPNLESIEMYECTSISDGNFIFNKDCTKLKEIKLKNCDNPEHTKKLALHTDGVLYNADYTSLLKAPSSSQSIEDDLTCHSSCTTISRYSCARCVFSNVNLGNVSRISDHAFYGATNYKNVTIPLKVVFIGFGAFDNAQGTVTFEGAEPQTEAEYDQQQDLKIEGNCFPNFDPENIVIPSRCSSLAQHYSGSSVGKIYICGGSRLTSFPNLGKMTMTAKEVVFSTKFADKCKMTSIADGAFKDSERLTKIENIPATVTSFGEACFANSFSATNTTNSLSFASGSQVTSLGASCFAGTHLKNLVVPDGMSNIGSQAFAGCSELETISFGESLQTCANDAFVGCNQLRAINIAAGNTRFASSGGCMLRKNAEGVADELAMYPPAGSDMGLVLLPPSITKIGAYSFYKNQNLTQLVVPALVSEIGNHAFEGCNTLTDIYFLGNNEQLRNFTPGSVGTVDEDYRFGHVDADQTKTVTPAQFLANNVTIHYPNTEGENYSTSTYWGQAKAKVGPSFTLDKDGTTPRERYYLLDAGVYLLGTNAKENTVVIPAKIDDKNVSHIGDYCFQDFTDEQKTNVKEIVIKSNPLYIGAQLLPSGHNVENVFFASDDKTESKLKVDLLALTTAKKFGYSPATWSSFDSNVNVYVAKSSYLELQNTYSEGAERDVAISCIGGKTFTYQIPFPTISTKFGTFSREFDVDLQDKDAENKDVNWNAELDKPNIIAFTGFEKNFSYKDKEGKDVTGIIMKSINCDATDGTDGTYIPANTGVLLRAYTSDQKSPSGFYYRIGEKTKDAPGSNIMQCVTESSRSVSPTETIGDDVYTNYVISKGMYWSLPTAITIPAHKSYMHIKTGTKTSSSAAASQTKSVKMVFYGTDYLQGDVNGDYDIDSSDCKQLTDTILGNKTSATNSADVNGDGKVDIQDITTLIDIQNGNATPEWRTGN